MTALHSFLDVNKSTFNLREKKRVHFFSLTKCRKKEVTGFLLPSWVNPVTKKSNVFDFDSQKTFKMLRDTFLNCAQEDLASRKIA